MFLEVWRPQIWGGGGNCHKKLKGEENLEG